MKRRALMASALGAVHLAASPSNARAEKAVMILGGTGRLGAIATAHFVSLNIPTKFLTRSPEKVGVFGPKATGVVADLEKPETLERAFEGVDRVLMIQHNGGTETQQGLNAVAAMRRSGVRRVVYVSHPKVLPHYFFKADIEAALIDWGIPVVVLRPNYFTQFDLLMRKQIVERGVYPYAIGYEGVNRVDCRDIVDAAVPLMTANLEQRGDIELHGPEPLTGPQVAQVYSRHLGRKVVYVGDLPSAEQEEFLPPADLARKMLLAYQDGKLRASASQVAATERAVGHSLRSFEAFVREAAELWKLPL